MSPVSIPTGRHCTERTRDDCSIHQPFDNEDCNAEASTVCGSASALLGGYARRTPIGVSRACQAHRQEFFVFRGLKYVSMHSEFKTTLRIRSLKYICEYTKFILTLHEGIQRPNNSVRDKTSIVESHSIKRTSIFLTKLLYLTLDSVVHVLTSIN